MNKYPLKYEDLDLNLIILSSKNYVDVIAKDFAKNYNSILEIHQNEMGYFDKALKILNTKGDNRVYIQYNNITDVDEKNNKLTLTKTTVAVPVSFKVNSKISQKLQSAFNLVKGITLQKIWRNNYHKHCINKITIGGEEIDDSDGEGNLKINICVILLKHENDSVDPTLNRDFILTLIQNYEKNINKILNPKRRKIQHDEYKIQINFGVANLDKNKELKTLYNRYKEEKEINTNEKSKLFFIINDTNERFSFRSFKNGKQIKEYFSDLDNSEYFEDATFNVK